MRQLYWTCVSGSTHRQILHQGRLKMRILVFGVLLMTSTEAVAQSPLKVSDNRRFIVRTDGKPFFWLGDTAWELFHRLNREETEQYFKKRQAQGFTVIQAVALAGLDGLNVPNAYGEKPLINNDPTTPNEKYFAHVDWVIQKAAEYELMIALLPTWGDKVDKLSFSKGPVVFNRDNARKYGEWIGKRYATSKNIIWIIGGDRNPTQEEHVAIWRAMAKGVETGVGGPDRALMTFHPQPTGIDECGSAKWFHNDAWLDFNMLQNGHCRDNHVGDRIQKTYDRVPPKPVIDGEPIYEDHPVCFNAKDLGISSAYDCRKYAYVSVFAGSFGHTYGCHPVWQFYEPKHLPKNNPRYVWREAMDLPAANQMVHLKTLMLSREKLDRVPDQSLIANARHEHDRIQATRGKDYALVYSSQGQDVELVLGKIAGDKVNVSIFNPRTGEIKPNKTLDNTGRSTIVLPKSGYGQDWVVIVDAVK
jgi:hypothetical protein